MFDKTAISHILKANNNEIGNEQMRKEAVRGTTVQTGDIVKSTVIENGRVTTISARVEYILERVAGYSKVILMDVNYKSIKIACTN